MNKILGLILLAALGLTVSGCGSACGCASTPSPWPVTFPLQLPAELVQAGTVRVATAAESATAIRVQVALSMASMDGYDWPGQQAFLVVMSVPTTSHAPYPIVDRLMWVIRWETHGYVGVDALSGNVIYKDIRP